MECHEGFDHCPVFSGIVISHYKDAQISILDASWDDCFIYLHEWLIFMVNVGGTYAIVPWIRHGIGFLQTFFATF